MLVSQVKYLKNDGNYAVYEIGAGVYQFLSKGLKTILRNIIITNPIIHPPDTLGLLNDSVKISISSDVAENQIYYITGNTEPDS